MTEVAAIAPRRAAPAITRNLILVFQPGWQAKEDWIQIGEHVRRIDPTIGIYIAPCDRYDPEVAARAARLPSLVVSPGPLMNWAEQRGKRYHGKSIDKFVELKRLSDAGVPIPRTTLLQPDTMLDPKIWGEFVVIKPTYRKTSSRGLGFQLIRTERVRYRPPHEYPEDHPGRHAPMLVQEFIDTGPQLSSSRVLTLFGEPLYQLTLTTRDTRISLDASDEAIETAPIAHQSFEDRIRTWNYDADFIALARMAHAAIPEVPLKGVDVMRDERTGRSYVLEINPNSNSWHFSSRMLAALRERVGPDYLKSMRSQLDAFGTAAHVLAKRTQEEAE